MTIRTYSELMQISDFRDRYEYLKIGGKVGQETFGYDRYLNQMLYNSGVWRTIRNKIIIRDLGCDLGVLGHEIADRIIIHHMNPIDVNDILNRSKFVLDPEYLISTTHNTHQAIHYGDDSLLITAPIERTRHDTCPWKNF